MNLNEIIQDTLSILRLGTESSSNDTYRREFTRYANDAIAIISRRFKQTRTDKVDLDDEYIFRLTDLDRACFRVERVTSVDGHVFIPWEQTDRGTGEIRCFLAPFENIRTVKVTYLYKPARLVNLEDVPELPEFAHDLIPHYVAAQHRFSQDGDVAGMGNYQQQTFERMLNDLALEYYGDPKAYKLKGFNENLL